MRLKPIKKQDFPEWRAMRKALYLGTEAEFLDQEMEAIIKHGMCSCFCIKNDNAETIGLVELSERNIADGCLSSPVAYLEGLYLKPEYRSKGLGREVILQVMSLCRESGFSELATDTNFDNFRARAFYKALGFEELEHCVGFRIDIDQD